MIRWRRKGRHWAVDDEVLDWFYVRYRTVYLVFALALLAAGMGAFYYLDKYGPTLPERPAEARSQTTARFAWIEGSVKVRRAGQLEWRTADRHLALERFDLVRTGPRSVAEIVFFDHTVVHVRPDSLITIEDTKEDRVTRERRVGWHVSSGEVNFETARHNVAGSVTTVSTPTTRGTVDELARASVRVAGSGATDLSVYRGSGRFQTRAGQSVELVRNEVVRIDSAGVALPKRSLPGAPVLLDPPHQAAVAPQREKVQLSWTPVAGAASYHVMMDVSARFPWPFLDQRGLTGSSVEIRGLDRGKYYWRVAAEAAGSESAFSDYARLTVAQSAEVSALRPPRLEIDAVDVRTNILQIKGRTTPGASVSVNGYRLDVNDDGSFNDFVTLTQPGRQEAVVRAAGLDGGVTERLVPIAVVEP